MKNHVTHETAKRLKAAGFPQPELKVGQLWCNEYGAYTFIVKNDGSENGSDNFFFCTSLMTERTERIIPANTDAYFVPTATDILRELSYEHYLRFNAGQWQVRKVVIEKAEESAWSKPETMWHDTVASNQNPAEAAAIAWLFTKNKL